MDFRRSGQRRRRTLLEERDGADEPTVRRRRARQVVPRAYADSALDENQSRVTDLIPRWDVTILGLFCLGLACIAGWVALDSYAAAWSDALGVPLTALSLGGSGGLAAWWMASLYLVAFGKSLLIYQVRRYRNDDYRGSYYVWLWAAATWLVASLDVGCGLRSLAAQLLARTTQVPLLGDGAIWGEIVGALVLAPLLLRLAIEVAESRPALAALAMSAIGYAVAALVGIPLHPWAAEPLAPIVSATATLVAQQFLMLSLGYYARYVYLDSQGEIDHTEDEETDDNEQASSATKKRASAANKVDEEETEEPEATTAAPGASIRRSDLDTPSTTPPARGNTLSRLASAAASSLAGDEDDEQDEGDYSGSNQGRKLSKAERKRLRKLGKAG